MDLRERKREREREREREGGRGRDSQTLGRTNHACTAKRPKVSTSTVLSVAER